MGGSSLICRGGAGFPWGGAWGSLTAHSPLQSVTITWDQGRREGGQGGKLPRAPRSWGPLEIFCWAPVIIWVKYFREKGKIYLFFWAKYWNSVRKIEVKALESNYNVLVRKIFFTKKCCRKKICPGPPPSSRRPCLRCPNLPVRRSVIILCLWSLYPLFITCAWLDSCCRTVK